MISTKVSDKKNTDRFESQKDKKEEEKIRIYVIFRLNIYSNIREKVRRKQSTGRFVED